MTTNANDLAYPTENRTSKYADLPSTILEGGLTKREFFTAMAMQGLAGISDFSNASIAENAVRIADATIIELNKGK